MLPDLLARRDPERDARCAVAGQRRRSVGALLAVRQLERVAPRRESGEAARFEAGLRADGQAGDRRVLDHDRPDLIAPIGVLERELVVTHHGGDLAAFDHRGEPAAVQAAYGPSTFGRHCLVARRLVEAGVTCVEIQLGSWDGHKDNFRMHADLSAKLDTGLSALLDELATRGLLDRTLVLCVGEFGRSPSISKEEGRDHHTACFSALLAGGGLRAGQVLGATDAAGAKAIGASVTFPDLFATLLTAAGIDPTQTLMLGDRPITLGNNGRVLPQLLAAR